MSGIGRSGEGYLVSYRDPNLQETNRVYEGIVKYLQSGYASDSFGEGQSRFVGIFVGSDRRNVTGRTGSGVAGNERGYSGTGKMGPGAFGYGEFLRGGK